jgi:hypothetical protein
MTGPQITANLTLDNKGFKAGLDDANKHKETFGSHFKEFGKELGHGFKDVGKEVGAALFGGIVGAIRGGSGAGSSIGGGLGGAIGAALGVAGGPWLAVLGAGIGARIGESIGGGVQDALKASLNVERAIDDLDTILRTRLHKTYEGVKEEVEATAETMHKFGFGTADTTAAIGQLITSHMSLEKAQRNMALVADVAAKREMSLADSARYVGLASMGSLRGLREIGVHLKGTGNQAQDAAMAMRELHKFTGAAQKQAERDPWKGMRVAFEELNEVIGKQVAPVLRDVAKDMTAFFSSATGAKDAKAFWLAIADGLKTAWRWAKNVVETVRGAFDLIQHLDLGKVFAQSFILILKVARDGLNLLIKMLFIGLLEAVPAFVLYLGQALVEMLKSVFGAKLSGYLGLNAADEALKRKAKAAQKDTHDDTSAAFRQFGESARSDAAAFAKQSGLTGSNERVASNDNAAAQEVADRKALPDKVAAMKASMEKQGQKQSYEASVTVMLQESDRLHGIMAH